MTNEPVDTVSKERRRQAYHTTLLLHHGTHPDFNHWQIMLQFYFNCSHVLPVNNHCVQRMGVSLFTFFGVPIV